MGALSRVSGFATLPIQSIPPVNVHLSINYGEVTLVSSPRISRGVARVLALACANEHLLRKMDSLVAVQ